MSFVTLSTSDKIDGQMSDTLKSDKNPHRSNNIQQHQHKQTFWPFLSVGLCRRSLFFINDFFTFYIIAAAHVMNRQVMESNEEER